MLGIQGFTGIQGFKLGIQGFTLGIHGFTSFSVFSACFSGIHRDSGIRIGIQGFAQGFRDSRKNGFRDSGIRLRDSGIHCFSTDLLLQVSSRHASSSYCTHFAAHKFLAALINANPKLLFGLAFVRERGNPCTIFWHQLFFCRIQKCSRQSVPVPVLTKKFTVETTTGIWLPVPTNGSAKKQLVPKNCAGVPPFPHKREPKQQFGVCVYESGKKFVTERQNGYNS